MPNTDRKTAEEVKSKIEELTNDYYSMSDDVPPLEPVLERFHEWLFSTSQPSPQESGRELAKKKLTLPLSPENKLVRWANSIRGFYGHPIYLVGSQITGADAPRDVDVVCPIPDNEFELRYGSLNDWMQEGGTGLWTEVRWKWSDDCVKRALDGMRETNLVIDFKVQPMAQWRGYAEVQKEFPPYRLDTRSSTPVSEEVTELSSSIVDEYKSWKEKEGWRKSGTRENYYVNIHEGRSPIHSSDLHEIWKRGLSTLRSIIESEKGIDKGGQFTEEQVKMAIGLSRAMTISHSNETYSFHYTSDEIIKSLGKSSPSDKGGVILPSFSIVELEDLYSQIGEDWLLWDEEEQGQYPIQRVFDAVKKFIYEKKNGSELIKRGLASQPRGGETMNPQMSQACGFYMRGMDTSGRCNNCGRHQWEHDSTPPSFNQPITNTTKE